ncbi:MAG: class F sortase [Candidatus Saccharibacteria bacterium]
MYVKHKILSWAALSCLVLLPVGFSGPEREVPALTFNGTEAPAAIDFPVAQPAGAGSAVIQPDRNRVEGDNATRQTNAGARPVNPAALPVSIRIATIGLNTSLVKTGLESDGSLHVPSDPGQAGWYTGGPKPGEKGPAVITGHYDSAAGPGVFYSLKKAAVGDTVTIAESDGSELSFRIDRKELYLQDDFPTQAVYGPIDGPGLRVITCAGTYNPATKHYSHDLVVFASLVSVKTPG